MQDLPSGTSQGLSGIAGRTRDVRKFIEQASSAKEQNLQEWHLFLGLVHLMQDMPARTAEQFRTRQAPSDIGGLQFQLNDACSASGTGLQRHNLQCRNSPIGQTRTDLQPGGRLFRGSRRLQFGAIAWYSFEKNAPTTEMHKYGNQGVIAGNPREF